MVPLSSYCFGWSEDSVDWCGFELLAVTRSPDRLAARLSTASSSRVTGGHSLDTRDRLFPIDRPEEQHARVVSGANTRHSERGVWCESALDLVRGAPPHRRRRPNGVGHSSYVPHVRAGACPQGRRAEVGAGDDDGEYGNASAHEFVGVSLMAAEMRRPEEGTANFGPMQLSCHPVSVNSGAASS